MKRLARTGLGRGKGSDRRAQTAEAMREVGRQESLSLGGDCGVEPNGCPSAGVVTRTSGAGRSGIGGGAIGLPQPVELLQVHKVVDADEEAATRRSEGGR